MKQLTEAHFQELQHFTAKHFVEYYDVQLELVDHLATAIEQNWSLKPDFSFEEILQSEFDKFGVFGFTVLVEKRQWELKRYYYQQFWKSFKSFFGLPKIVLTTALAALIYFITIQLGAYAHNFFMWVFAGSGIILVVDLIAYHRKIKKQQKNTNKKWLIESVALQIYGITSLATVLSLTNLFRLLLSAITVEFQNLIKIVALVLTVLFFYILKKHIQPMIKYEMALTSKRFKAM